MRLGLVCLAVMLVPATAVAQEEPEDRRDLWGYVFAAPSILAAPDNEAAFHWGGGLEWTFFRSVGIAAEAGSLHASHPAAMLSFNGLYRFSGAGSAVAPFVTAGYTRGPWREQLDATMFNTGVGVTIWPGGTIGFRGEIRYHLWERDASACVSPGCRNWLLGFRGALTFGR